MATHDSQTANPPLQRAFGNAQNIGAWRKRAEGLRALAKATRDERQRAELYELAGQWEGMAAQAELYARWADRQAAESQAAGTR